MKKSILFAAAFTSLASCAVANTNSGQQMIIDGKQVTVYENFKLVPRDNNQIQSDKHDNESNVKEIARINDLSAIESNSRENINLALVVSERKQPFMISPNIYFKCPNQGSSCELDGFEVKQVGNTQMFSVTVDNLNQWTEVMELLKNNSNVISVMPEYDYGVKNSAD